MFTKSKKHGINLLKGVKRLTTKIGIKNQRDHEDEKTIYYFSGFSDF